MQVSFYNQLTEEQKVFLQRVQLPVSLKEQEETIDREYPEGLPTTPDGEEPSNLHYSAKAIDQAKWELLTKLLDIEYGRDNKTVSVKGYVYAKLKKRVRETGQSVSWILGTLVDNFLDRIEVKINTE